VSTGTRPSRLAALSLVILLAVTVRPGPAAPAGPVFTRGTWEGRTYRLWIPSRVDPERPLVVALHGCGQTPEDLALGTRLNQAAERRRLVVLYPAQRRGDNPSRCWNWFEPRHQSATRGEPAAILGLARRIQAEHGLREPRVLALGFSAGGFMAVTLACAAPATVAGLGVAAAGPYACAESAADALRCMRGRVPDADVAAKACEAAGGRAPALRASLWHGARDAVVSPANLVGLEAMLARLLEASAAEADTRAEARRTVHRDPHGRVVVESWLVAGMGHAWSGGDPRGTHTYPPGPDATARMLDLLLPVASR
jgi:poly(hydroxyalkanoate) depolymerase family esterase